MCLVTCDYNLYFEKRTLNIYKIMENRKINNKRCKNKVTKGKNIERLPLEQIVKEK